MKRTIRINELERYEGEAEPCDVCGERADVATYMLDGRSTLCRDDALNLAARLRAACNVDGDNTSFTTDPAIIHWARVPLGCGAFTCTDGETCCQFLRGDSSRWHCVLFTDGDPLEVAQVPTRRLGLQYRPQRFAECINYTEDESRKHSPTLPRNDNK